MGTYLSTPVTEKRQEAGTADNIAWGVVDMQGWRKSMEDAHVAWSQGDAASVFAVFDGHGGPEVARFCQLYLVSVLQQQPEWKLSETFKEGQVLPKETPTGRALVSSFHALDRMIDDPNRREELIRLRAVQPNADERLEAVIPTLPQAATSTAIIERPEPIHTENPSTEQPVVDTVQEDQGDDPSQDAEQEDDVEDDDSDQAVGKEQALEDREEDPEEEDDVVVDYDETTAGKVSFMFQRLLNISGSSGQIVVQMNNNGPPDAAQVSGPSANAPTMVRNGRLICNLPDHPIHAGATAIVVVLRDNTITVANAGDSRAVLCRNGTAYPLSFDHKPLQERELLRIRKAGGFVNHFGRVNGNLNLSRSIGDLKYKANKTIPPSDQMITAEPDIVQTKLEPSDEFIVLGCDGIWDCLTNDKAVAYIRSRIDRQTPTEIGAEMLDEIMSEDPRATQGIGGDNMTIMIVDLQPQSRSYYLASVEEDEPA